MRFLLTVLPAFGHWQPMAAMGEALRSDGHEVMVATGSSFRPWVEGSGFEFRPAGLDLFGTEPWMATAGITTGRRGFAEAGVDLMPAFNDYVIEHHGPVMVRDVVDLVGSWGPDVLVHDSQETGGPVAATLTALPHARLSVTCPFPGDAATTVALGDRHGLAGVDVHQFLCLDRAPPTFRANRPASPTTHSVRPTSIDESGPRPADCSWVTGLAGRPTVFVTMGTTYNGAPGVFEAIVEGLGGQGFNVVVATGPNRDPAALGPLPRGVIAVAYVPQSAILEYADVVVTHAGFNSLMGALARGRPVAVCPLGADQHHNADVVVACGAGVHLERNGPLGLDPAAALAAVRRLLADPSYRSEARRLADEIAAMPGVDRAVKLLERLGRERRPVTSAASATC